MPLPLPAVLAGLLLAPPVLPSGSEPNRAAPAQPKVASTPEQAVQLALRAMKAGDCERFLAQLAEPSRTLEEEKEKLPRARAAFYAALDRKFGKDPNGSRTLRELMERTVPNPPFREAMKGLKNIQVLARQARGKGRVELTLWQTWEPSGLVNPTGVIKTWWTAVKVGPGWKLLVPYQTVSMPSPQQGPDGRTIGVDVAKPVALDPKMAAYLQKTLPKERALVEGLTRQVRRGKYKSRQEALAAYQDARKALAKANPSPLPPDKRGR